MILKPLGTEQEEQIKILRSLLKRSNSPKQKKLIEDDLKKLENGYRAEKENAYYLNFEFEDSKNIIVLHDLRLKHQGYTAQIDHILISRSWITLLESKSFTGKLTIKNDGSLHVQYPKNFKTFPNPVEQNERHKKIIESLIDTYFDLPSNIKMLGGLEFQTKVLINPQTTLVNKELPDGFARADSYVTQRRKEIDKIGAFEAIKLVSKTMTFDKAKELAQFLISRHEPFEFDYTKKYRVGNPDASYVKEETPHYGQKPISKYYCPKCQSKNLAVKYGHSYYFKCLDCGNNIPIKHTCKTPQCKPKTQKRKNEFFKVCDHCGTEELFFVNKV